MSFPRLNRQLVLEKAIRVPDGAGGYATTWAGIGILWAELEGRTGRARRGAETPLSTTRYRITVRAAPFGAEARPEPGQRFRDEARLFAIKAVTETDPDGRFLTCFAEEEVAP
ncbi:head-tail adaptor, putative [Oceanicola granulosus HTCC2516]|uniref:Head-tail adaptor, putative n=1 Tax=Oceanicola granulosus (strain ATCC BAA-861 / DSM 15982 / KCTC 12143 / HTCC2516) TaxID=314256 RepID=Q2CEB6_OCEGH|nr:head-tail adaptor protein [Oceanicola granulosus]EAR51081.1 head-tail adaptor, putative [Oceanicola granulosus HTCC2516]